jgi:hypothetical protein
MLNRYAGRDISQWLEDDDDAIDLVIQDVLSRWQGDGDLAAFWTRYANSVEYAPPGSPNEYREGFAEGEDLEVYYRSVWAAHAASLRPVGG